MPPKSNAAFRPGDAVEVHFGKKLGWCTDGSVISYDASKQEYEVYFKDDNSKATCPNSIVRGWVKCDGAGCKKEIKTKTGDGPWPNNEDFMCSICTNLEKRSGRNQVATTMPPKLTNRRDQVASVPLTKIRKADVACLPSPSEVSPESKGQGKGKKELRPTSPTKTKSSFGGAFGGHRRQFRLYGFD